MTKQKKKPINPAKKCKLCRQDSRRSEKHFPPLVFTIRDEEGKPLYSPTICMGCCLQIWEFVTGLIRNGTLQPKHKPQKKIIVPSGTPPGGIIKPS